MRTIDITEREAGQRLDKFLGKYMSLAPKSFFYKMLRKKNIVLNGKKADGSERLAAGDCLTLYLSEETIGKFSENRVLCHGGSPATGGLRDHREKKMTGSGFEKSLSFSLLYEDANILALNKPWGMLTQKAKPEDLSLNEYMTEWLLDTGRMTEEQLRTQKPSVCNRLDRNTSGIVLAGISLKGLQGLSRILKDRTGEKRYYALVWGQVKEPERLKGYLVKDTKTNQARVFSDKNDVLLEKGRKQDTEDAGSMADAKYIETAYRPLSFGGGCTLLEIHLITGRSHQIRAQLSAKGHFIIGDPKYGRQEINREFSRKYGLKGQLLHAGMFVMPTENCPFPGLAGKKFTAPLESRFVSVLDDLGIPVPAELKREEISGNGRK